MIKSEKEYTAIVERIEELLSIPENIENPESKGYVELNLLSDLEKALSQYLGVSSSRISEYLNGKSEPTLKVAREISRKLDIEASIVLGV